MNICIHPWLNHCLIFLFIPKSFKHHRSPFINNIPFSQGILFFHSNDPTYHILLHLLCEDSMGSYTFNHIVISCAIFFILDILYYYVGVGIYEFTNKDTPPVHLNWLFQIPLWGVPHVGLYGFSFLPLLQQPTDIGSSIGVVDYLGYTIKYIWVGHVWHFYHELSLRSGDQNNPIKIISEDVDMLTMIFDFIPATMGCVLTLPMSVWPSVRCFKEVLR